jgi:hypothetical protein
VCSVQIKLTNLQTAAESAYRSGAARTNEMRGKEFERAWRLVEHRRVPLELARQALRVLARRGLSPGIAWVAFPEWPTRSGL